MELHVKPFASLTLWELYDILKLRSAVFVVEQDCVCQDMDDKDKVAIHVWITEGEETVACARVLPAGVSFEEPAIGRMVTGIRGKGYGLACMAAGLETAQKEWGAKKVRISAQAYAEGFYNKLGFFRASEGYLEDNIPHFQMLWEKKE